MKIVNIDVSDQLKFKNIEETETDLIKFIKSTLEVPTDNYKSVLLNFNFISPDATLEGLNLFAIFTAKHLTKPVEVVLTDIEIDNNFYKTACFIPNDVLTKTGTISLGVYGYVLNEDETLNKRISLKPISFAVIEGSYKEGAFDVTIPEPTDFEIYFAKIEKATADLETLKRQTEEDINDLKVQTEEDILEWKTTTKNELDEHLVEQDNNISDISDNVIKIETAVNENAEEIEKLNEKNILTVGLAEDLTITSTSNYQNTNIPLTKEIFRFGEALQISDGKIVIPAGVSKILLSADCLSNGEIDTFGLIIKKNNTELSQKFYAPSSQSFANISLSPLGIDVSEGDVLSLNYYINDSGFTRTIKAYSGYGTYLTVQVIE